VIRNAVSPEATARVDEQMCAAGTAHLLQNAVKFTHPLRVRGGGSLARSPTVALSVSDTGVGMAPESGEQVV
jgi:hypothetical protein